MNHLTLETFAARADGLASGAAEEAHLAGCAACQAEARRWNAVGRGVRLLTAAYEPPPLLADDGLAAVGQPPSPSPWQLRRVALVSVAAAVVLGVTGYGLDSMLGSSARPPAGGVVATSAAELAAALTPTECTRLEVLPGTLESVSGSRVTLRTAGGKLITVTTSNATQITRQVAESLRDIKNGMHVLVDGTGSSSGAAIAAQWIAVLPRAMPEPRPVRLPGASDPEKMLAQRGHAQGTVTGVDSGGFTVVQPSGRRVRVTTSSATTVIEQVNSTLAELQKGKFTAVVGTPQPNGTMAAASIQQNALTGGLGRTARVGVRPPNPPRHEVPRSAFPKLRTARNPMGPFSGLGCDSAAIATTAVLRADS